jgi:hypothetical protein
MGPVSSLLLAHTYIYRCHAGAELPQQGRMQ